MLWFLNSYARFGSGFCPFRVRASIPRHITLHHVTPRYHAWFCRVLCVVLGVWVTGPFRPRARKKKIFCCGRFSPAVAFLESSSVHLVFLLLVVSFYEKATGFGENAGWSFWF